MYKNIIEMADLTQSIQDLYYDWVHPAVNWITTPTIENVPIYRSVKSRLDDLNYHLNQTKQELRAVASAYDNAKSDTADKEAIYNACNKKSRECLDDIKASMLDFCQQIACIQEELVDQEDEIILETMNKLVNSISKLKKPNDQNNLFEWVDTTEYWSLHDYQQAVSRRDDAKEELERSKRNERPFAYRLEEVKDKMNKIEKERDTLADFSNKYKEGYVQLSQRDPPPPYEENLVHEEIDQEDPAPTFSETGSSVGHGLILQPPMAHTSVYGVSKPESAS